ITTFLLSVNSSLLQNTDQWMPMPFTLETLPIENLYRILSHIDLKDRVRVRECNTTMREAIEQSDFIATKLVIYFDGETMACPRLYFGDKSECITSKINELRDLYSRQSRMFRVARIGELEIKFDTCVIDETVLEQVIGQVQFQSLIVHLHKIKIMQPSVLKLVQRFEGENRRFHTCCFAPDPQMIIELPRIKNLVIESDGVALRDHFNPDHILQIIGKDHEDIVVPMKLFKPNDMFRIIRAVHSNDRVKSLSLHVSSLNFQYNFLKSIGIREEGANLINISDANSPINLGQMMKSQGRINITNYYLSHGPGYLRIHSKNRGIHRIYIVKETLPQDAIPYHNFSLPSD
ncbi:hypothetical protein PFISCL1PPCAC_25143, partial [Pristionchus fissidentatus]